MQPTIEHISVPAGEFDATKIECQEKDRPPNKQRSTIYWYVASIGAMVMAVHRAVDANGAELFSISEQLVAYQSK